jgi:hypothetical protein
MIKDLSASLVAAAAAINAKTREAYVAEQAAIQAKKIAKMPQQPAPKAEPAASSTAKKMAEAVMIDEKLTDDAKKKIQTALGPKNSQMRQTSASAKAIIGLAKTNPANTVKKEEVEQANEAAEGTVPKTPREKELAAKHGNKNLITHGDVMKARGIHKEEAVDEAAGWNPIKHIPKEKQTDAIKTAAKDVKRGSYADRAALLRAGGVKEEVQAVEGFMASMKKFGKKVVDTVTHADDVDLIKDLQKKVGVAQTGVKPKPVKAIDTKPKMAHDYVKEEKEESAAHEAAEKKKPKSPWDTSGPSSIFNKEKSAFTSKKVSTGTVYSRKAVKEDVEELDELSKSTLGNYIKKASNNAVISRKVAADFEHQGDRARSPGMKTGSRIMSQKYKEKSWKRKDGVIKAVDRLTKEEIECLDVQHEQFGAGKTLGQFSEDFSEVDVMFAEGIKRVSIDDIEMVEETTAIHPSAIHVSPGSNGKYKVHAVGKKFASGIKVGEHLTDTHLDDFSEMGGKIKMVKAPKKD